MRFVQNVGLPATRKLFYTAKYFDASEARRMGLLDYIVPEEELEGFTIDLAKKMASNAPLSMAGHKRTLHLLTKSAPLSAVEKPELASFMLKALSAPLHKYAGIRAPLTYTPALVPLPRRTAGVRL